MLRSIRKLVSAVFSVAAISGATGASAGDPTFPLATARDYLALTKTLADSDRLDEPDKVGRVHLAEALSYRALTDEVRRAA